MRPRDLDRRVVRFLDHKQLCTNWIQLYDSDKTWGGGGGGGGGDLRWKSRPE